MVAKFEVTNYYELVALHRALHIARFTTEHPVNHELAGSPFLADIARRIVETLAQMEIERGRPEQSDRWHTKIIENGDVWKIAVAQAAGGSGVWQRFSQQEKATYSRNLLSPFVCHDDILERFIQQVDDLLANK